jgi:2-polyprenyl-3-methyl-5-hydroxy-6-metoxy-1,4-benzoquinol methylase
MLPFGLDSDPQWVELPAKFGVAQLLDTPNASRQVPPASYDVVACFHVLKYVESPKKILTMLSRAATKYVLVAIPNVQKIPKFL